MNSLTQLAASRLQQQGGRMTAQRLLILETLEALGGHPTAEELYARVRERDSSVHLSTVYRTLRWLQAEGLVRSRWFGREPRQERFDPNRPVEHYHFVCKVCNQVIEFLEPLVMESLETQFERRYGASVEHASLMFYGLCPDCRDAALTEEQTEGNLS